MELEFEGVPKYAAVHSFNEGVLNYKVTLCSNRNPETQIRDIAFPIKNGILTVFKTDDKRENELISLIAKRLHEEYPHEIKEVVNSSLVDLI